MKDIKILRKEVEGKLKEKASEILKAFQSQRDNDLQELASLNEQLEKFENQKKELLATQEKEGKEFILSNKTLGQCALKMNHVEKNIRELQKRIDVLFLKVTKLPDFFRDNYPFLKLIQG